VLKKLHDGNCSLTLSVAILLLLSVIEPFRSVHSQNQDSSARQTGVLRLRVRVKADDNAPLKGLARKRFFLIRGSLEQNKSVTQIAEQRTFVSRDCYYSRLGASQSFIAWLKENDCESVYCRDIDPQFVSGPKAVPEFANAFAAGQKDFGSEATALKWLTTNLPENLRDGFYRDRQSLIQTLIKQAEVSSGTSVLSVMTDRNGTAYFTDLIPGTYVLTNLVPTELPQTIATWNCEVEIKVGEIATEKPYLVSNRKDRNVKCVAVEKPLPVCDK
jgi:hypothetical protein